MASCEIVELEPQPAAVVEGKVPLAELSEFFGNAFEAVMQEAQRQGLSVVGAPFGYYAEPPTDLVTVAAGFPVSGEVTPTGDVTPMVLPGGRAVTVEHVGPYDTLERTYGELETWVRDNGLTPAHAMWESYLSDPADEPPERWRTVITQPLA